MPIPHRTFSYLFEDYKNNIFREWWQKEKGEKRILNPKETLMFVLLIAFPVLSLVLYGVVWVVCPQNIWAVCVAYIPILAEVILIIRMAGYVEKRDKETLDEKAQQYYEQRIKPLYDCLHEQDYDNRLSLAWIIQCCQEIIDQGCGFEKILKRFGRYYVVCILPILAFCAVTILKTVSAVEQCMIALMGVGLLLAIFALSQMISPDIIEFASKRLRIAKEIKENAEYLLAQGDLEITDKPRAALEREAASVAP